VHHGAAGKSLASPAHPHPHSPPPHAGRTSARAETPSHAPACCCFLLSGELGWEHPCARLRAALLCLLPLAAAAAGLGHGGAQWGPREQSSAGSQAWLGGPELPQHLEHPGVQSIPVTWSIPRSRASLSSGVFWSPEHPCDLEHPELQSIPAPRASRASWGPDYSLVQHIQGIRASKASLASHASWHPEHPQHPEAVSRDIPALGDSQERGNAWL